MSRKYKNPPIVEAFCEFHFIPSQPWDMTIPGLLYDEIKDEFPDKKQQMGMMVGFQPKESGLEQKVEMNQRMQFFRNDKSALVQVGADMLTTNHLLPYPTWEGFKPLTVRILGVYKGIAKPNGFKRIVLRYINKVDFEKVASIELTDYFNYYPFIPGSLPQSHETFNVRVEIPYEEGRDRLLLILTSIIPGKPGLLSLSLDLHYIMAIPERITFDQFSDWIENAHTVIEEAFEACITDKSRELFEEEK